MRATRPLFRFDPGWLFIVAGLAVCAAGVLLPAQADLRSLEEQLDVLHDEEARAYQRLAAHADFIDQVDRSEPAIIKRLAAAQLNLVPEGDKPVVLAASNTAPVTSWIDSTLVTDIRPAEFEPVSTLSRWANGPSRLWMFGGGIMAVFIGLLISPEGSKRRGRSSATALGAKSPRTWAAGANAALVEEEDDADFVRAQSMVLRFARPEPSLPETVDLEDRRDLSQQEDTVDLEENELPALSRTVIDDDVAWHDAATIEHASEVIVEANEVASPEIQQSLWKAEIESEDETIARAEAALEPVSDVHGAVSVSASEFASMHDDESDEDSESVLGAANATHGIDAIDEDDECAVDADDGADDENARLAATAMLLPTADEEVTARIEEAVETVNALNAIAQVASQTSAPAEAPEVDSDATPSDSDSDFGSEPPPVVEMEALKADLGGATTTKEETTRKPKRDIEPGSKSTAKAASKKAAKPGKTTERKPAPRKSSRSERDASAIPFLRYRPTDNDEIDADEDGEVEAVTPCDDDEGMIAMDADSAVDEAADDAGTDEDSDDGPLRFR